MILIMPCKRQNGSNQHHIQDKENVPPFGPYPKQKNVKLTCVSQSLKEVNGLMKRWKKPWM
jgi:hypothetical protein